MANSVFCLPPDAFDKQPQQYPADRYRACGDDDDDDDFGDDSVEGGGEDGDQASGGAAAQSGAGAGASAALDTWAETGGWGADAQLHHVGFTFSREAQPEQHPRIVRGVKAPRQVLPVQRPLPFGASMLKVGKGGGRVTGACLHAVSSIIIHNPDGTSTTQYGNGGCSCQQQLGAAAAAAPVVVAAAAATAAVAKLNGSNGRSKSGMKTAVTATAAAATATATTAAPAAPSDDSLAVVQLTRAEIQLKFDRLMEGDTATALEARLRREGGSRTAPLLAPAGAMPNTTTTTGAAARTSSKRPFESLREGESGSGASPSTPAAHRGRREAWGLRRNVVVTTDASEGGGEATAAAAAAGGMFSNSWLQRPFEPLELAGGRHIHAATQDAFRDATARLKLFVPR